MFTLWIIGLLCQSAGFVDFTKQELASDGFISTIRYTFNFDAEVAFSGTTITPSIGKCIVVAEIQSLVDTYLATVFTDAAKSY